MDVTYNFTAGTRAVAQQVDTNFADVKSAVDPLETAVADIETQLTSGIILPDGSIDFTRLQSYATYVVSNATNTTPIVITAVAHSFLTGDKVRISGVGGNTAANGTFTITKMGADTFSLDGSVGNGAFTTNGTVVLYPSADDNLANKAYVDTTINNNKSIIRLGTCSTASATTEKVVTIPNYTEIDGCTFDVIFTNRNTVIPTLNVNLLGPKTIYTECGVAIDSIHPAFFPVNSRVRFTYRSDLNGYTFENKKVTHYRSGTTWANVYTDGFIEQGGSVTYAQAANTKKTVPLVAILLETDYYVHFTTVVTTATIAAQLFYPVNKTTTSFDMICSSNPTYCYWSSGGY